MPDEINVTKSIPAHIIPFLLLDGERGVGRQQANASSAGTSVAKTNVVGATTCERQSTRLRSSGAGLRDLGPATLIIRAKVDRCPVASQGNRNGIVDKRQFSEKSGQFYQSSRGPFRLIFLSSIFLSTNVPRKILHTRL